MRSSDNLLDSWYLLVSGTTVAEELITAGRSSGDSKKLVESSEVDVPRGTWSISTGFQDS